MIDHNFLMSSFAILTRWLDTMAGEGYVNTVCNRSNCSHGMAKPFDVSWWGASEPLTRVWKEQRMNPVSNIHALGNESQMLQCVRRYSVPGHIVFMSAHKRCSEVK